MICLNSAGNLDWLEVRIDFKVFTLWIYAPFPANKSWRHAYLSKRSTMSGCILTLKLAAVKWPTHPMKKDMGWTDTPTDILPGGQCKLRSNFWWLTGFCNSHDVSHFAAFFIVVGAKTSVAESVNTLSYSHIPVVQRLPACYYDEFLGTFRRCSTRLASIAGKFFIRLG